MKTGISDLCIAHYVLVHANLSNPESQKNGMNTTPISFAPHANTRSMTDLLEGSCVHRILPISPKGGKFADRWFIQTGTVEIKIQAANEHSQQ